MNEPQYLSRLYPAERLAEHIPPYGDWCPFPTVGERAAWEGLPDAVQEDNLALGKKALGTDWPPLPASLYMDFALNGNRSRYETPYFTRRNLVAALALAECTEGQGRFMRRLMDAVWSVCEESSWCLPAHTGAQSAGSGLPDTAEPVVDLFAAETASLLAWVLYLLGDRLATPSPRIPERIEREIQARMLIPALQRDDWVWLGFRDFPVNNWNPWINSNWLACVLLVEKDPARRVQAVDKILHSVDRFLVPYPADGGCDEGPGYWGRAGASLYDCLELLYSASGGKIDIYNDPKVGEIGRYIYRLHIDGDSYVNFADASALNFPDAGVVFGYGRRIRDPRMTAFGAWLAARPEPYEEEGGTFRRLSSGIFRTLPRHFSLNEILAAKPEPPYERDIWLSDIQVMAARDQQGSGSGWYLAAKGGHNAESHNHNDVGNFIIYRDGNPAIVDAGVEAYTRKTFSPQRYEIWTMQSAYHSLPTIGGIMQSAGRKYAARDVHYEANDDTTMLRMDIAGAYPAEAGLQSWERTLALRRGQGISLEDRWTLQSPAGEICLNLLTPCKVDVTTPGMIRLSEAGLPNHRRSGAALIRYDPGLLALTDEEIEIEDEELYPAWGERLTRLLFRLANPGRQGGWKIEFEE